MKQKIKTTMLTLALGLQACGEGSGFKSNNTSKVPPEKAVPTPVPEKRTPPTQPIQGFQTPELRGADIEKFGGSEQVLEDPIDPVEVAVQTQIEGGIVTTIGAPTTVISSDQSGNSCPNSVAFTNGTCLKPLPVFIWKKEGALDLSKSILSFEPDTCTEGSSDVCNHLLTNAKSSGYRSMRNIAFRSFDLRGPETDALRDHFVSVSICHDSVPTAGTEKEIQPDDVLQSNSCITEYETFYGLSKPLPGTVPVYRWTSGSTVTLSLSSTEAPGPQFNLVDAVAFYALPPLLR